MPRAWASLGLLLVFAVTAWGQSPAPKKGKLPPDLTEILSHMNAAAGNLRTISANLEYTKVTVLVDDKAVQSGQLLYRRGKGTDILIDFLTDSLDELYRGLEAITRDILPKVRE